MNARTLHGRPVTRRTITLADFAGAPTLVADCWDRGWNGFHVPLLTAATFQAHVDAIEAVRPGYFDGGSATVLDDPENGIIVRWTGDAGLEDDLYTYADGSDDAAWFDGLVWSDPWTDDDE